MTPKNSSQHRFLRALVISGILNVILFAFFTYHWINERPPIPYYVSKPTENDGGPSALTDSTSNEELIRSFQGMSLEQLVSKLNHSQLIENGYSERDLALGSLITFHHFNLSKALYGLTPPTQLRVLSWENPKTGKKEGMTVYPGLSEEHYQAIIHYANTERWPLTSEGLFLLLQKPEYQQEPSLEEAFLMTPEFSSVATLFSRLNDPIENKQLLTLIKEGNWPTLSAFTEQQRMTQDLSDARRMSFLLDYLSQHSKTAALLLLKIDPEFAEKKLDDPSVVLVLSLLTAKTPEAEKFALEMIKSPRSDAVWQQAASRLYEFSGESPPLTDLRLSALKKFAPESLPKSKPPKQNTAGILSSKTKASTVTPSKNTTGVTPPYAVSKSNKVEKKEKDPLKLNAKSTQVQQKIQATPSVGTVVKKASNAGTMAKKAPSPNPVAKKTSNTDTASKKAPAVKKDRLYIVKEGDSLWKISKQFHQDVEVIKKHNRLSSDSLKPGTAIRIPL